MMANDAGYIDIPYRESECFKATNSCNNVEQLENRRPYALSAIHYHTKEGNPKQVAFFTEELNLIDKKLKKLSK